MIYYYLFDNLIFFIDYKFLNFLFYFFDFIFVYFYIILFVYLYFYLFILFLYNYKNNIKNLNIIKLLVNQSNYICLFLLNLILCFLYYMYYNKVYLLFKPALNILYDTSVYNAFDIFCIMFFIILFIIFCIIILYILLYVIFLIKFIKSKYESF